MAQPEIPILPDQLVRETYEEAITAPRSFVTGVVESMLKARSYLLYSYLVDGLRISGKHGEYAALHHLRQVLLIPACLDRYSRLEQKPEVRISKRNISSLYNELGKLSVSEKGAREKSLHQRIASCNPLLVTQLDCLKDFAILEGIDSEAQNQSSKKAFRAFELYERQIQDPSSSSADLDYETSGTESTTNPVPTVKSSIVDRALLDIALNGAFFLRKNLKNLQQTSEGLAAYIYLLAQAAS